MGTTKTKEIISKKRSTKRKAEVMYDIFISYNIDNDSVLAGTLKDKLTILGKDRLNINVCSLIPGGKDWRKWIMEHIQKSSIFIFLYTKQDNDWNWCIHEAGIFRGSKESGKGHLICLKNEKIKEYLDQIDHLQAYLSKKGQVKRFLKDLLYHGKFTNGDKINPDLLSSSYENELETACDDISNQFASTPLTIDYLPRRLKIGPLNFSEKEKPILEGAKITGNRETMELFNFDYRADLYWEDLYNRFHTDNCMNWVDDIASAAEIIRSRQKPRRLLHPFKVDNNIKYYPILSRIDRIENEPICFYVIFIGERDVEKKDKMFRHVCEEPLPHKFLNDLIFIARSFRWDIVECILSELNSPALNPKQEEMIYERLIEELKNIEKSGQKQGMRLAEAVKTHFPPEYHQRIEEYWDNYRNHKNNILKSIEDKKRDEVINIMEDLRAINKDFLLMSVYHYYGLIKLLKPVKEGSSGIKNT